MSSVQADTLPGLFLARVAATPEAVGYLVPQDGGWRPITWSEVDDAVRDLASGLRDLGLQDEERCAILSMTRYEWILAELAINCAAGATTTIYPSNTAEQAAFILRDSQTAVAFVEDAQQLQKLEAQRASLPALRHVIMIEGSVHANGWVLTLEQLRALGKARRQAQPDEFERVARSVRKDSLATLIYTSGTTGQPKGVELTQDCWVYEAEAIDALGILKPDDLQYLWLPLAHSLGKVLELAQLRIGFATGVDGRVDRLVENLASLKPTFMAAVPRIFEKVHNKVVLTAKEGGAVKWSIFRWALGVGQRVSARVQAGKRPSGVLALEHALADRLVFSTIREKFGGRIRYFVSGSAPLAREVAEFFHAIGLLILEGYGLTETSAASFVNRPDRFRFGTVGPPLPGTEVKLAPEDGEILVRSRGVMRGYHGLPAETAEALTPDGWMRTGDIGVVEDGMLKITDRKKDLIKTSSGKYVAPQVFEVKLKALCPYVSQVLVHGNERSFCTALVTLDPEAIRAWAKEHGLGSLTDDALARNEQVRALVQAGIDQVNAGLASYESVRKFALLPKDWSLEHGELTPTLKVKRKVVERQFRELLDAFYAGALQRV